MRRVLPDGTKQTLTVPLHEELDRGTLKAIIRQVSSFIPEEVLKRYFYR
ncbi:type II toxin-antitoxin system HicA family toxin [Geoglobus acetivorans]